jgi:hypothetical protein
MKLCVQLFLVFLLAQISWSQINGYVHIAFNRKVHFVVTDSLGRRSGVDPRIGAKYNEIPNADYSLACCGSVDSTALIDEGWEFMFLRTIDSLFGEKYSVEFIGRARGIYNGGVGMAQSMSGKGASFNIKGVIDSAQSIFYKIVYMTDSTQTPTLTKVVDTSTFRQDLNNCYALNLVRTQSFYQSLNTQVRKIDSLLALGDTVKAIDELFRTDSLLDNASGDTTLIIPDGYQILKEDVSVLLTSLGLITVSGTLSQNTTWKTYVRVIDNVTVR